MSYSKRDSSTLVLAVVFCAATAIHAQPDLGSLDRACGFLETRTAQLLDGAIGTGAEPSAILTPGYHAVTTSVMDSGGLSGDDSISVVVQALPDCPANNTVDTTISGMETHLAVDTMTLGANLLVEATGNLTVVTGNAAVFIDGATIEGDLAITLDPQPCP